jgi:hypothetical protein
MDETEARKLLQRPPISVAEYRLIANRGKRQAYDDVARGDVEHIRLNRVIRILSVPLRRKLHLDNFDPKNLPALIKRLQEFKRGRP